MTGELKHLCIMNKKYKGDDNWDGFLFPFELPNIPALIPESGQFNPENGQFYKGFPQLNPDASAAATTANSVQSDANHYCFYHHYAVTQLAKKVLDNHPQEHDLNTSEGLPFRSSVFLYGPTNTATEIDTKDRFSELIRLEGALYGSIGRLLSNDVSRVVSHQLLQTLQLR